MTEKTKKPSPAQKELKLRARTKGKKPKFVRAESWKYDRFAIAWRRPRGLDNKIRRKILGWPPGHSMGYKGPKVARFLHPSGYREVIVNNTVDLAKVTDVATQAARIAHTVGKRKRTEIIAKAKELNIKILNLKVTAAAEEKEEEAESEETAEAEAQEAKETKEEAKEEKPKKAAKEEKKKAAPKKAAAKKPAPKAKKKEETKQ